jgi:hypothetical protein
MDLALGMRRAMTRQAGSKVIAIVLAIAVSAGCADRSARPSGIVSVSPAAGVIGPKWLLTQVTTANGTVDVPAAFGAGFQFTPDGKFLASDGVNSMSGSFRTAPGGFDLGPGATTLVGYAGTDPTVLLVVAAIAEVASHHVTIGVAQETLSMSVPGYRLALTESPR